MKVEVSYDTGATWVVTALSPPANTYAWQEWKVTVTLPSVGFWSVYVRATDHTGAVQPMLVPPWNPGGYGNNQATKLDIEVVPPAGRSKGSGGGGGVSGGGVSGSGGGVSGNGGGRTSRQTPCWL